MSEDRKRIPLNEERLAAVSGGASLSDGPDWLQQIVEYRELDTCSICNSVGKYTTIELQPNGKYKIIFECLSSHVWTETIGPNDWY